MKLKTSGATVCRRLIARTLHARLRSASPRTNSEFGILVSGSGTGMCIAANKVRGVRAAVVQDEFSACRTREKYHCNILCLAADLDASKHLKRIVDHFLAAKVESGDTALTLEKLAQIERLSESGELSKAKDAAESGNQARDRLLAMLGHELRGPLSPALMTAMFLEEDKELPEHVREDISLIRRNIELEAQLIDALLDLTRIANGKLSLHTEIIDVHELLAASVATCGPDAFAMSMEVRLDLHATRHTLLPTRSSCNRSSGT